MWAYLNNLAVLITINAILAVTLNFVLGYAGIFSMAHAAFFGIGAYTAALVAIKLGGGFLLATAAGMSVAGLLSLALALPARICASSVRNCRLTSLARLLSRVRDWPA